MIFSNLFHRKKNKESETGSFSQYDQSEYAKLETKNIVKELNLSDAAQAKKYVVDLCKQMIQASKDIEDSKSEYQLVTNYLTDIQILEDLTDAERKPILECATQVAKLEKQRTDFLKTKRRLTDTQFAQMQEEEENLPDTVKEAMLLSMRELFSVYCKENQKMKQEQLRNTLEFDDIPVLVDHIAV